MADFCYECTAEMWEGDNGPRNDMAHDGPDVLWWLCESCGGHAFTPEGKRLCGRPQSDFHHVDGPSEYTPAWPDPCPQCVNACIAMETGQ